MSQPCMCGATDCPRCYPGCGDYCECEDCGAEMSISDLEYEETPLCDYCRLKRDDLISCVECGDEHPYPPEHDDVDDFVCDDCKEKEEE